MKKKTGENYVGSIREKWRVVCMEKNDSETDTFVTVMNWKHCEGGYCV